MSPQPSGNGTQFAGDAPTRLLPPVGHDDDVTAVLGRPLGNYERWTWRDELAVELREKRASHFDEDLAAFKRDIRIHGFPQPADETAVIPVTPAKPEPPKANNDDPWKECFGAAVAGLVLAAVIFVAGVLAGAWWF